VSAAYNALIRKGGNEFNLLTALAPEEIERLDCPGISGERLAEAIRRMRAGNVSITPGYDGEYGIIHVFDSPGDAEPDQNSLFGTEEYGVPDTPERKSAAGEKAPFSPLGKDRESTGTEIAPEKKFTMNPEQERAVTHNGGHALIIAGPGTGKTAVLTARIAHLVSGGADPAGILAVTFTVRAAAELRERIAKTAGAEAAALITAATFHSFCSSVLREHPKETGFPPDFTLITENAREELLNSITGKRSGRLSGRRLGKYIEERKRFLFRPGERAREMPQGLAVLAEELGLPEFSEELDPFYAEYQRTLRGDRAQSAETDSAGTGSAALDFDDLVLETVLLLAENPDLLTQYRRRFRFIFVDEYQDVNFGQYALIRLLAPSDAEEDTFRNSSGDRASGCISESSVPEKQVSGTSMSRLCVIGDPNQAIYAFRGADKRFIDRFTADYPGAARYWLTTSFRCAAPIIDAAGSLVGGRLEGADASGAVYLHRQEFRSERAEAEAIARRLSRLIGGADFLALDSGVVSGAEGQSFEMDASPGECAILIRTGTLAPVIQKALRDHGIPFRFAGEHPWWEEDEAKAVIDMLRAEPHDESSVEEAVLRGWHRAMETGTVKLQKRPENSSTVTGESATVAALPESVQRLRGMALLWGDLPAFLDILATGMPGDGTDTGRNAVSLMTIHASKGLEFDHVFVPALEEGVLPHTAYERNDENLSAHIEEEKRLLYVAMTRARKGLYLSWSQTRGLPGRNPEKTEPSRFLRQLEHIIPLLQEERIPPKRAKDLPDPQLELF
jgi:superfamily I DNA/RNA helicase